MEDIELVIKISNYDKEWITNGYYIPEEINMRISEAIANGTPLPKGHGDLVDFDKLCREYWDGNYMEIHRNDLQSIKPIIEADTESEDEKCPIV